MKFTPVAAACFLMAMSTTARAEAPDLVPRMNAYNDAVVDIMKSKGGLKARADRFETVVRDYYDMPAITAMVVGPKWSTTSADDRGAAIAAITRHSAITLARGFGTFAGEKFSVDPAILSRGTSRIVKVRIESSGKKDLVFYQLREAKTGWRIIDVISGGISQLAAQRADVASAVAAGGAAGLAQRFTKLDAAVR